MTVFQAEAIDAARDLERCLELNIADGINEVPPVSGVRYAAAAVLPSRSGGLLAFVIGHIDEIDDGVFVPDVLRVDVSQAAADAMMQHYGIPGSRYDADLLDAFAEAPLAQAAIRAHQRLLRAYQ